MMKVWMGIDPGAKGAYAVLREDLEVEILRKSRASNRQIAEFLGRFAPATGQSEYECFAVVEYVLSIPGHSKSSNHKLGFSFGTIIGMLEALRIPYMRTLPRIWQYHSDCLTGGEKNISKDRAIEMFHDVKVIHENADALLLSQYARWIDVNHNRKNPRVPRTKVPGVRGVAGE